MLYVAVRKRSFQTNGQQYTNGHQSPETQSLDLGAFLFAITAKPNKNNPKQKTIVPGDFLP